MRAVIKTRRLMELGMGRMIRQPVGRKERRRPVSGLPGCIAVLLAACLFTVSSAFSSLAAENTIKTVLIEVKGEISEGGGTGDVSVSTSSSKYHVSNYNFINEKNSWKAGEVPRLAIELTADSDYEFSRTISASQITVKGASYVSRKPSEDLETLTVTVKLKAVKGSLGTAEDAYWEKSPLGKAKWSKVDNAPAYELKLYRGDDLVYHVNKTTTASYDFYPYMTRKGDYYYRVRAIAKSDSEAEYLKAGEWMDSSTQEIDNREASAAEALGGAKNQGTPDTVKSGWNQDRYGFWYQNEDGSYPVNRWQSIDGKWYLFNMEGYMLTGWQNKDGHEYYLTSNGDMVSGWYQENRTWYYLDPDQGKYTGGWLALGDKWYYFNPDGSMAAGWIKSKDKWYYLSPSTGEMVTGQVVEQYYVNSDGVWVQ